VSDLIGHILEISSIIVRALLNNVLESASQMTSSHLTFRVERAVLPRAHFFGSLLPSDLHLRDYLRMVDQRYS
jgi:hypothetical protein